VVMFWLVAALTLGLTGNDAEGREKALKAGDPAPNFEAVNQDGKKVKLSDFKGKWVVLAFFVKAKTPG